jgi:hypothetical protein
MLSLKSNQNVHTLRRMLMEHSQQHLLQTGIVSAYFVPESIQPNSQFMAEFRNGGGLGKRPRDVGAILQQVFVNQRRTARSTIKQDSSVLSDYGLPN